MNPFYIGIPGWLLFSVLAYGLREIAIGRLSPEQVGTALLAHRPDRLKHSAWAIGSLLVFFLLRFSLPQFQNAWFLSLLGANAALAIYFEVRAWKLAFAILPVHGARMLMASRGFALLGVLLLIGAMAFTVM